MNATALPNSENAQPITAGAHGAPASSIPRFQPVARASIKTADEALAILADEATQLSEQEQALHISRNDVPIDSPRFAEIGQTIGPVARQLRAKWSTALPVRPDTPAGLASKARIALSMRYGLEGCQIEEAGPLLLSLCEDVVRMNGEAARELWAKPDAELIRAADDVVRLCRQSDAIHRANPDLDEEHPTQIAWSEQADRVWSEWKVAIDRLSAIHPQTLTGMSIKAGVVPALTGFIDFVKNEPDGDLVLGILADARRIGAGMSPHEGDGTKEAEVHTLVGSSEPSGRAPSFEPLGLPLTSASGAAADAVLIARASTMAVLAGRAAERHRRFEEMMDQHAEERPKSPEHKAGEDSRAYLNALANDPTDLGAAGRAYDAVTDRIRSDNQEHGALSRAFDLRVGLDKARRRKWRSFRRMIRLARNLASTPSATMEGVVAKACALSQVEGFQLKELLPLEDFNWTERLAFVIADELASIGASALPQRVPAQTYAAAA